MNDPLQVPPEPLQGFCQRRLNSGTCCPGPSPAGRSSPALGAQRVSHLGRIGDRAPQLSGQNVEGRGVSPAAGLKPRVAVPPLMLPWATQDAGAEGPLWAGCGPAQVQHRGEKKDHNFKAPGLGRVLSFSKTFYLEKSYKLTEEFQ